MARIVGLLLATAVGTTALPTEALAQDDARLRRIESELRALQRAVFPGGDGRFFEPEVVTGQPQQSPQPQQGTPANSALTDVLARLEAIEGQVARLTARSEENSHQLGQLEEKMQQLEATAAAEAAAAAPSPQPTGVIPPPGQAAAQGSATAQPAPAASRPSPERVAAVQAIAKPQTADAGDDEYTYGFRLWEAGYYPEAQQQLTLFLDRFPNHTRTTFGRNLLGRAFLDNGQPREAATHFFQNYQTDKQAARAPDSLLFLAEAMVALNDTNRACIALAEFGDTYPALATGRLKEQYDRNRNRVDCN